MLQVEGDLVVPVELVSTKPEVGARTLRPKLLRVRDQFLRPLRRQHPNHSAKRIKAAGDVDVNDIPTLLARLGVDHSVSPVGNIRGGYKEAKERLDEFVTRRLPNYAAARARPSEAEVSTLSPYLHFGQISPIEVALAAHDAEAAAENSASFLEELIVDRYDCLPEWARQTLAAHRQDRREHVYSLDRLACADTLDPYWNAAMRRCC